jgi:alpha-tubulin suppressor-like RCC1 family protein
VTPNIGTGRIADIAILGALPTIQVLKADGTLYAFGRGAEGAVGNNSTADVSSPVVVATGVTALLTDGINSNGYGYQVQGAVLKADGLYMCGYNSDGECGLGNTASAITTLSKTLLPADFTVKLLGSYNTNGNGRVYVAVSTDNRVYTWGYNAQYGVSTSSSSNVITPANVIIPRG